LLLVSGIVYPRVDAALECKNCIVAELQSQANPRTLNSDVMNTAHITMGREHGRINVGMGKFPIL